jgi:transposase
MDTERPHRPHRPHTPPHTSASDATRDKRLQVQTLRDIGWSYSRICKQLDLTRHQITYAATHRATPKKRKRRPPALNQEELNRIIEWICASQDNRRTAWIQIPIILELNIGFYALRTALRNAGFARRVARRKPPVSETNRQRRLQWATEYVDWSIDQWKMILWSDEIWINGDRHTKTYITRRKGEEYDPICVIERYQRRKEWIF